MESSRALVAGELDVIVCRGAPRGRGVQQLVSVEVSRDHVIGVVSTATHSPASNGSASINYGASRLRRRAARG